MKTTIAYNKSTAILRAAKAIDAARISLRAAAHANDDLPKPHQAAKRAGEPDLMLGRLVSLEHRHGDNDRGSQPKSSDRQFEQSYLAVNPSRTFGTAQAQGESHGDGNAPFIASAKD